MTGRTILAFDLPRLATPAWDDLAMQLPEALRERQLRGCFGVAAEALSGLAARGRREVIEALGWHELGLCYEPAPLPAPLPTHGQAWWAIMLTCHLAALAEQQSEFVRLCGRPPSFLTVPSARFAPQVGLAAARLGIPLLVNAPFEDNQPGLPLWYCGCGYLRRHLDVGDILVGAGQAASLESRIRREADTYAAEATLVVGADLGAALHRRQADSGRDCAGPDPDPALWRDRCGQLAGAVAPALGGTASTFSRLTRAAGPLFLGMEEVVDLARQMTTCLRPLRCDHYWLSLAELFSVFVQAGKRLAEAGQGDEPLYPQALLGPFTPPPELGDMQVRRQELLRACVPLAAELAQSGRIPAVVQVEGRPATPSSFLSALAEALSHPQRELVKIPRGPLPQFYATRRDIRHTADELAAVMPGAAGRLHRNAVLTQCWTARPWA